MTVSPKSVVAKISGEPNARTADPERHQEEHQHDHAHEPADAAADEGDPERLGPVALTVSA